jgi:hypothetical protein
MTQEVLKFTKAITEPNTITFHNSNADWVMRITADRRIEVNEDVEVTEAAQKVLDAMQYLLKAQTQEPVSNDPLPRACNLAGVDYQTFLKIKAYMPVAPPQRTWVGGGDLEDSNAYLTPPQSTERPVDCERCNRLEEQAYDLVGKLRVANIKLSMQPQRTWVGLTDDEIKAMDARLTSNSSFYAGALWAEAKLKEKNT